MPRPNTIEVRIKEDLEEKEFLRWYDLLSGDLSFSVRECAPQDPDLEEYRELFPMAYDHLKVYIVASGYAKGRYVRITDVEHCFGGHLDTLTAKLKEYCLAYWNGTLNLDGFKYMVNDRLGDYFFGVDDIDVADKQRISERLSSTELTLLSRLLNF